ncbi:MAG: DEAD/DEAH box helicase family protein, partial [Eggerthellaceae bacterium]|nr:DEAD/DEAH box helicase family protein [Eggerthellaceae bacterium]
MSLRDLDIKSEYRTKISDISREFLVPILSESISYNRAVGFFSSTSLMEISKGIGPLAQRGGTIRIIASPKLSESDVTAIEKGYTERDAVIKKALIRELPDFDNLGRGEKARLNLLANLIATGVMDIRIAFVEGGNGIGIYHEKLATIEDEDGNVVAFSGSMNETKTAIRENYEAIDVFCSWKESDAHRVSAKTAAFEAIWNGYEVGVETCDFPDVKDAIRERYLVGEPNYGLDSDAVKFEPNLLAAGRFGIPRAPDGIDIRDYQNDAVDSWVENGYQGLFDMATGTGKTITGLLALTRLYENVGGKLTAIITCPYQHLVEQWIEDLNWFNVYPIIAYSKSRQRDWRQRLTEAILDQKVGIEDARFVCCITTNATLSSKWMQQALGKIKSRVVIIADEAHNLGAPGYQKVLNETYDFRLALSATFERHHDEGGTAALRSYFGQTCITYPLERAIREGKLSEYRYHPVLCTLNDAELEEYQRLTREIGKCMKRDSSGRQTLSKSGEILAQQRARVVAAAENKLGALRREIQPYLHSVHILVYCGAASLLAVGDDRTEVENEDRRQIAHVVSLLGNELGMTVSKFTSEEDIDERETLKKEFSGGNVQALVAIKCLD